MGLFGGGTQQQILTVLTNIEIQGQTMLNDLVTRLDALGVSLTTLDGHMAATAAASESMDESLLRIEAVATAVNESIIKLGESIDASFSGMSKSVSGAATETAASFDFLDGAAANMAGTIRDSLLQAGEAVQEIGAVASEAFSKAAESATVFIEQLQHVTEAAITAGEALKTIAFDKAPEGFEKINNLLPGIGLNLDNLIEKGKQLTEVIGIGAVAALGYGADQAVKFQDEMNKLQNNTTLTDSQMKNLSESVKDMASGSDQSIAGLSEGLMHISNFGYQGADAMKILTEANMSAASTGANVADVSNILANVMHEYGASINDVAGYMNVMHLAAAEGNMTLEEFDHAAGRVFAQAANLGVGITDASAAMEALTKHGYDASQAGTQVANILSHMVKPSKEAEAALADLSKKSGVDLVSDFSAAGLASKNLSGVFDDLQKAFANTKLSAADQAEEIYKLIPAMRGGLGAMALLGTANHDFNVGLIELNATMAGKTNPTLDAFTRTQQTATFQLGELKNNIQLVAISLGNFFLIPLTDSIKSLNDFTQGIEGHLEILGRFEQKHHVVADAIKETGKVLSEIGSYFLQVGEQILVSGYAFAEWANKVNVVAAAIELLKGYLAAAINFYEQLVTSVEPALAAFAAFELKTHAVSDTLKEFTTALAELDGAVVSAVLHVVSELALWETQTQFLSSASRVLQAVVADLVAGIDHVISVVRPVINNFIEWENRTHAIEFVMRELIGIIADIFATILPPIIEAVQAFIDWESKTQALTTAYNILKDVFVATVEAIRNIVSAVRPVVDNFIEWENRTHAVEGVLRELIGIAGEILSTLLPPVIQIVQAFFDFENRTHAITEAFALAKSVFSDVVGTIQLIIGTLAPVIEKFIEWESHTHAVENVLGELISIAGGIINTIVPPVVQAVQAFLDWESRTHALSTAFDLWQGYIRAVIGVIGTLWSNVAPVIASFVEWENRTHTLNSILDTIGTTISGMINTIGSIAKEITPLVQSFLEWASHSQLLEGAIKLVAVALAVNFLSGVTETSIAISSKLLPALAETVVEMGKVGLGIGVELVAQLGSLAAAITTTAAPAFLNLIGMATNAARALSVNFITALGQAALSMSSLFAPAATQLGLALTSATGAVGRFALALSSQIVPQLVAFATSVSSTLIPSIIGIATAFGPLLPVLAVITGSVLLFSQNWGGSMQSADTSTQTFADHTESLFSHLGKTIGDFIGSVGKGLDDWFQQLQRNNERATGGFAGFEKSLKPASEATKTFGDNIKYASNAMSDAQQEFQKLQAQFDAIQRRADLVAQGLSVMHKGIRNLRDMASETISPINDLGLVTREQFESSATSASDLAKAADDAKKSFDTFINDTVQGMADWANNIQDNLQQTNTMLAEGGEKGSQLYIDSFVQNEPQLKAMVQNFARAGVEGTAGVLPEYMTNGQVAGNNYVEGIIIKNAASHDAGLQHAIAALTGIGDVGPYVGPEGQKQALAYINGILAKLGDAPIAGQDLANGFVSGLSGVVAMSNSMGLQARAAFLAGLKGDATTASGYKGAGSKGIVDEMVSSGNDFLQSFDKNGGITKEYQTQSEMDWVKQMQSEYNKTAETAKPKGGDTGGDGTGGGGGGGGSPKGGGGGGKGGSGGKAADPVAEALKRAKEMGDAAKALSQIHGYYSPTKEELTAFENDVVAMTDDFAAVASKFNADMAKSTTQYADTAIKVADAVAKMATAFKDLKGYSQVNKDTMKNFVDDSREMVQLYADAGSKFKEDALTGAIFFAEATLQIGDSMVKMIDGFAKLKTWSSVGQPTMKSFVDDTRFITDQYVGAGQHYNHGMLDAATSFADATIKVGDSVLKMADGMSKIAGWHVIGPITMQGFVNDVTAITDMYVGAGQHYTSAMSEAATSFAETTLKVADSASKMADALNKVRGWSVIGADLMQGFVNDETAITDMYVGAGQHYTQEMSAAAESFGATTLKVADSVSKMADSLKKIANWQYINTKVMQDFVNDTVEITDMYVGAGEHYDANQTKASTLFSDATIKIGDSITKMADGFNKIKNFSYINTKIMQDFVNDMTSITDMFVGAGEHYNAAQETAVKNFSDTTIKMADAVSKMADGFSKLKDYSRIGIEKITAFNDDLGVLTLAFVQDGEKFNTDMRAAADGFAKTTGDVGDAVGKAVSGLDKLNTYMSPGQQIMDKFNDDVEYITKKFAASGATLKDQLPDAQAFGSNTKDLFTALDSAAKTMASLQTFTFIDHKVIDAFFDDVDYTVKATIKNAGPVKDDLPLIKEYGVDVKDIFTVLKDAATAFKDLEKYKGADKATLDTLFGNMKLAIDDTVWLAGVTKDAVAPAEAFSEHAKIIFSDLDSAVKLFQDLEKLKDNPAQALEVLKNSIGTAIQNMSDLEGSSEKILKAANDYAQNMANAAAAVSRGNNAFAGQNGVAAPSSTPPSNITIPATNGSHADGLDSVPFDGYIAVLHKGERVLTAQQNAQMSGASSGGGGFLSNSTASAPTSSALDYATKLADTATKIADAIGKIADAGALSSTKLLNFIDQTNSIVELFSDAAEQYAKKSLDAAVKYADAATKFMDLIVKGVDAILKLPQLGEVSQYQFDSFYKDITTIVGMFSSPITDAMASVLAGATLFADTAGKVVAIIATAVAGFSLLQTYVEINQSNIDAFFHDVWQLVYDFSYPLNDYISSALQGGNMFATTAVKVVDVVTKGIQSFNALNSYAATSRTNMNTFFQDLMALMYMFGYPLTDYISRALAGATAFSDTALKVISVVKAGVDAFAGLDTYTKVTKGAEQNFFNDLMGLMYMFSYPLNDSITRALEGARVFSDTALKVLSVIKEGVTSLTLLNTYTSPPYEAIKHFTSDIKNIVSQFSQVLTDQMKEALTDGSLFADTAAKIMTMLKNGVDAMTALAGYTSPARSVADQFISDVKYFVNAFSAKLTDDMVKALQGGSTFADTAVKVVGMIKTAVDNFGALTNYSAVNRKLVDQFISDVTYTVQDFLTGLSDIPAKLYDASTRYADMAVKVVDTIKKGVESFASLAGYQAVNRLNVNSFINDLIYVINEFLAKATALDPIATKAGAALADSIGKIIAPIDPAVKALTALQSYWSAPEASIDAFFLDLKTVINKMIAEATNISTTDITTLTSLGEMLMKATDGLKKSVDLFVALNNYVELPTITFDSFFNALAGIINRAKALMNSDAGQSLTSGMVTFAQNLGTIFDTLKKALDLFSSLNNLGLYPSVAIQSLFDSFTAALQQMATLQANADLFYTAAQSFANKMQAAAQLLVQGLTAPSNAIQTLGGSNFQILPPGFDGKTNSNIIPQSGGGVGSGQSLGGSSSTSATTPDGTQTPAKSQGNQTYQITIEIKGNVYGHNADKMMEDAAKKVIDKLTSAARRNGGSFLR